MKVIIPYKDFGGVELRYCLRGIEKFIDDPEITIIGDKPKWIKNVNHIFFKSNPDIKFKSRNIYEKTMLADHDFLFFNDDHFLLSPFIETIYYYSGTINSELESNSSNMYKQTLRNTLNQFGDIKNFDTHCPIFFKKEILQKIKVDWNKPHGYGIKSIYGYVAGIAGTEYPDLKIRDNVSEEKIKKQIAGREYFSTGNAAMGGGMIKVLEELYPEKSIYE